MTMVFFCMLQSVPVVHPLSRLTVHVIVSQIFGQGQAFDDNLLIALNYGPIFCWFRYVPDMSQEVSMPQFSASVFKR